MKWSRVLVLAVYVASLETVALGDAPPPTCAGTEPYRFTVQGSVNDGGSWSTSYVIVYASAGSTVYLKARTLLTVTTGATGGWSFGLRHDASQIRSYGGDMVLEGVTTTGTSTETVQNGSRPDFDVTEPRAGFDGWSQAIMIDASQEITLPPASDFVTAGACYRIQVPYGGTYYRATISFTNDIGSPIVDCVVSQGGHAMPPCARKLTIYVYPYAGNPTSCSLGGDWLGSRQTSLELASDGPIGDGLLDRVPVIEVPPFSSAETNADGSVDIGDPIYLLLWLFAGGVDAPPSIPSFITKTGQVRCYNNFEPGVGCPSEGQPFYGQDANFKAGYDLIAPADRYSVTALTVADSISGLMWTRNAGDLNNDGQLTAADQVSWENAAMVVNALNGRAYAEFTNWRLPRMQELLSIADYGRFAPALDPAVFLTPPSPPAPGMRYWTSEQVSLGNCQNLVGCSVNFYTGHTYSDLVCWVRPCRDLHPKPYSPGETARVPYSYGDSDGNGALEMTDALYTLNYLFLSGPNPHNVIFPATTVPTADEFIDLGDTVIDLRTGLEWLTIPDDTVYTWEDALWRASDLNEGGHSDWRLPNVLEAASILKIPNCVDGDLVPSVPHAAFLDLFPHQFVDWTFWLSDTSVYVNSSAWTINFKHGIVHDLNGSNKLTNSHRVLAVRSGL